MKAPSSGSSSQQSIGSIKSFGGVSGCDANKKLSSENEYLLEKIKETEARAKTLPLDFAKTHVDVNTFVVTVSSQSYNVS